MFVWGIPGSNRRTPDAGDNVLSGQARLAVYQHPSRTSPRRRSNRCNKFLELPGMTINQFSGKSLHSHGDGNATLESSELSAGITATAFSGQQPRCHLLHFLASSLHSIPQLRLG
ncbi:granule-bound starch synthase [Anopheles sinensis]|uniref:Granule-bound starch synthase n=1 Tax=Anopheles sinensis TaxID=74873 RepID=A0A084VLN5_ANOSI|nr:granule-bound starch synthase [Anopheles sinensis]